MKSVKKIQLLFLLLSVAAYILSLTQIAYCVSDTDCSDSLSLALMGILGLFSGWGNLSWLANPLLIASWASMLYSRKISLITSSIALLFAVSFLCIGSVVHDESGHIHEVTSYGTGYWLWVASCLLVVMDHILVHNMKDSGKEG